MLALAGIRTRENIKSQENTVMEMYESVAMEKNAERSRKRPCRIRKRKRMDKI